MYETPFLKQAAVGNLQTLVALLFPDRPTARSGGEMRIGNRGSLCIDLRTGLFFDHESDTGGDIISLVQHARQCDFREAVDWLEQFHQMAPPPPRHPLPVKKQKDNPARRKKALGLWHGSSPISGTLAEHYLRQVRGLALDDSPEDVRFHPGVWHFQAEETFPTVIAALRDTTGNIVAVHCVFLSPETGQKISLPGVSPKLSFAPITGAAVKLPGKPEHASKLAVCEGLEDALSLVELTGWPCWTLCGTGNFSNIEIPHHLEAVTIASDADEPGKREAIKLARRLEGAPYTLRVVHPPGEAKDWNEYLHKEKASAATPA